MNTLRTIYWTLFAIGNIGMALLLGYLLIFVPLSLESVISDILPAVFALIIFDALIIFTDKEAERKS